MTCCGILPVSICQMSTSDEDDKEYVVEKILNHNLRSDGSTYFLVKWLGYPDSASTWEPEYNLTNVQNLIQEYKKRAFRVKQKKVRGKQDVVYIRKPIAEVMGIRRGSPPGNIVYYVRFENEKQASELPSAIVREWDVQKLISFYESEFRKSVR